MCGERDGIELLQLGRDSLIRKEMAICGDLKLEKFFPIIVQRKSNRN